MPDSHADHFDEEFRRQMASIESVVAIPDWDEDFWGPAPSPFTRRIPDPPPQAAVHYYDGRTHNVIAAEEIYLARKDCPDCHGTGQIALLTKTVPCKCRSTLDAPAISALATPPNLGLSLGFSTSHSGDVTRLDARTTIGIGLTIIMETHPTSAKLDRAIAALRALADELDQRQRPGSKPQAGYVVAAPRTAP